MSAHRHGGGSCPPVLRKLLLWCLAILAALVLAGFIGYAQLLSYLQGQEFRSTLQKHLLNKTQASTAAMAGTLEIDANRVSLQRFSLLWDAGRLHKVDGKGIHADIKRSALLERKLHLNRLMVEEGSLALDLDRKGGPQAAAPLKKARVLSRLAPTQAVLERFDCKDFHATLRSGGKDYSLTDSTLAANPTKGNGKGWEFRLSNGRLHTPLPIIGDCSLKAATLVQGGTMTTLSDARLMLSPGELIVNAVREQASGNWSADIRANSVDVARFIGEDWKKRVSGMLYGRLQVDGQAEGLRQAEGRLSLQQGVLEALPFLENLPVGNSYPYRSLHLEKATARLSYPHADAARNISNAWLLDDIELQSAGGWLRVRGHVFADADGSLGGTLFIGLPENVATRIAPEGTPLYQSIFNAGNEQGYRWLRLNLSGSIQAPQEDLSVRLRTLLHSALPEAAKVLRDMLLPGSAAPAAESPAPAGKPQPDSPAPQQLMEEAGQAAGELISTGLRHLF